MDDLDRAGLCAALASVRQMMALSSRDWSLHANDAWLWGLLLGWDGDPDEPNDPGAWQLLADRHGWDAATLARLRSLHAALAAPPDHGGDLTQLLAAVRRADERGDYRTRNRLILRVIDAADRCGYRTGLGIDPTPVDPAFPLVAYVELPTGQVSWRLPLYVTGWDGHRTEEKYRRIDALARRDGTGAAATPVPARGAAGGPA